MVVSQVKRSAETHPHRFGIIEFSLAVKRNENKSKGNNKARSEATKQRILTQTRFKSIVSIVDESKNDTNRHSGGDIVPEQTLNRVAIDSYGEVVMALLVITILSIGYCFHQSRRSREKKGAEIQPIRASPFHPNLVPSRIDTIVIGSGSGGCACANLLAQAGQRVLLLEQHNRTGGCTHSFRDRGCEWDTGLHYTARGMSDPTQRAGALLHFMTKGLQEWSLLQDPYDEVVFPPDDNVAEGLPNQQRYAFVSGAAQTVDSILNQIDPGNEELRKRMLVWMDLCMQINRGFTALGLSRILPKFLQFLVRPRIEILMKYASYTVRDVQYAIFNLGYSIEQLVQNCPQAPKGTEPDPVLRRLKGCSRTLLETMPYNHVRPRLRPTESQCPTTSMEPLIRWGQLRTFPSEVHRSYASTVAKYWSTPL